MVENRSHWILVSIRGLFSFVDPADHFPRRYFAVTRYTRVRWQITLCDPIQQVTLCSSAMGLP